MYTQSLSPAFSSSHASARALHHSGHLHTHNNRQEAPKAMVSRSDDPVSGERLQKVVDRHLLGALEKAIGMDGVSLNQLNADDFSPKKTADSVLAFVNQAFGRLQNSQPDFDKDSFFSQVKEGIETGFKEARNILHDLGALDDRTAANIDETYHRIQDGLAKLETGTASNSVPGVTSLALQSQSAEINKATQIEIMTQEGDVIKIGLGQSLSKSQSAFNFEQEGGTVSGFQSQFSSSSSFDISIEGDLSEDEQKSLKHLLKQMDKVGHAFFSGNIQAAFQHAGKLDIDGSTIAGFSMNLEMSKSVKAVAAYQQVQQPEQNVQPERLKQASDFFSQAHDMLKTAQSALAFFDNPLAAFNDLFAGVGQIGLQDTGASETDLSGRLMEQLVKPLGQSILETGQVGMV